MSEPECPVCGYTGREDSELERNVKALIAEARRGDGRASQTWWMGAFDVELTISVEPIPRQSEPAESSRP